MPLRIESQAEPIPGYRLIEKLGSGGFGEVWKAEAPGGLFKAIKFVQRGSGNDESMVVGATDPDRSRADQEMKSLSRVKTVHHPYVISLDRFEIVDDYLVIVMELADRTLADRFKQCRSQGLPGVPREELLNYLQEAAEALDLMNSLYQLQHLDIKPQNLFLVHNHIKVADFGLVKDITDQKFMTITGGVTPVYAAPETFDGKFSRQSDQYSLAIVYQEILTGHRPFTGTTMKQLILQHLQNAHNLTPAPVHDRPIIARALAKNPEDRFVTCLDFVQSLRRATLRNRGAAEEPASAKDVAPLSNENSCPSISKTVVARGSAGPIKPADPNFSVEKEFLGEGGAAQPISALPPSDLRTPSVPAKPRSKLQKDLATPATPARPKKAPQRAVAQNLNGVVQPALIIALGRIGIDAATQMRQRIATELGSPFALPHVRVVAIDTDPEMIHKATLGNDAAVLRTQETLLTRLQRPSHYLKTRDGKLPTDSWLNPKLLYRIPREQSGAGLRALGRLAFVDNYRVIAKRLEAELHALCSQDTPHDATFECDLGLRTTRPRVYLATSLTGNTGGGMFVDVAYLLRKLLNDQGHADAEMVGLFFLPHVQREAVAAAPVANAHAALIELQHYLRPDVMYSAQFDTASTAAKSERISVDGPMVQRCIFLPLEEMRGKLSGIDNKSSVALAGDFLYRDLATALGQTFDDQRDSLIKRADEPVEGVLVQSVGMCRIYWPRHALLEQGARVLCTQLVTRWMEKDPTPIAATIRQWTHECWESLGLRPENLIERFQQMSEHALQQKPEALLAEVLAPAQEVLTDEANKKKLMINMSPIVQTMDRLERTLGVPEEIRAAKQVHIEPGVMEQTLADISHIVADEYEQRLAELAVTLLEDPNYRLVGAEESLRQFCAIVEQALQSQETLAKELSDKAAQLHVRILQMVEKPLPAGAPTSTQWSFGLTRRSGTKHTVPNPGDLFELLRTYTKTRYHSIVLSHLNRLYLGLRGHLSDQIREVGFCRQRLGELLGILKSKADTGTPVKDDRALFPPGCKDLNEAVKNLTDSVTIDDLICFDERMQAWIKTHCQALLQICMGSSTTVKNVAPAMMQEAEAFLGERLEGDSVAEMYLTRQRSQHPENGDANILDDLERCLDDATPEFGRLKGTNEVTVVAVPNNSHGIELQQLLRSRLKDAKILLTDRQDEMLFYHEIVSIAWKDLEQLGPVAEEIYHGRCTADPSALHTREDVFEWQILTAGKH